MELSPLEPSAIQSFRGNFSDAEEDLGHLMRCWAHQDCDGCLDEYECSWCPYTWSCVPNSYKIPLLAPAYDEHVCPHPAEQWELRSRPFGCRVSSTTSLTAIVAIVATVAVALFVLLNVVAAVRWRRYTKQTPNWRQEWRHRWREALGPAYNQERDPLLANAQGVSAIYGGP